MAKRSGFTLIELLIGVAISSVVIASTLSIFGNVKRTYRQEHLKATVEATLRWSTNSVLDNFRYVGYGVPAANLSVWVPWVTGFTSNPQVVQGTGGNPDTLTVARCTSEPITTVASDSTFTGSPPTLPLTSAADLNTTTKKLIYLDDNENAHVQAILGTTVTLDADPLTVGNQAPGRSYPQSTPVCRVDVLTFDVDTANNQLRVDKNDGLGPQVLLDGIEDLQIVTITAGELYQLTLTARSLEMLPGTGAFLTRRMSTMMTVRNN